MCCATQRNGPRNGSVLDILFGYCQQLVEAVATYENIAILDADVRKSKQELLTASNYAQQL